MLFQFMNNEIHFVQNMYSLLVSMLMYYKFNSWINIDGIFVSKNGSLQRRLGFVTK